MDRQKILLIFGAALVSATLLTWFLYAKTQAPRVEKRVPVMAAARDLPPGTLLRKNDLRPVSMAERDLPRGALLQEREALNRVLLYPMSANEPITAAKLSAVTSSEGVPSTIEPGYRAVAVPINESSGVAGLIQPGARVDVLFTRPGNMTEAITTTVLQDVKVLSIGRYTQPGQQPADTKGAPRQTVATLVVTPEEAQKVELAKNQGRISLALRNPLDRATTGGNVPVTTEVLDPMVSARIARAKRGRTTRLAGNVPNLEDPKVWQELTGERKARDDDEAKKKKEPEKPRVVVDVYRGDKHVQELFR
jgi:pilus assembly protein CpaB